MTDGRIGVLKTMMSVAAVCTVVSSVFAADVLAQEPAPGASDAQIQAILAREDTKAAFAALDRGHDATVAELIELTEIPAPPFMEEKRAEVLRAKLEALGLQDVGIDEEGNVTAIRRGSAGDGRFVALIAHLDSVFPEGTDVTVKREGTTLRAPGIGDDAKGLSAMLAYVRAMNEAGITTRDDLLLVGSVGEEGEGDLRGVRYLFTKGQYKDRIKASLALDGGNIGTITNGATGSKRYRVTFKGPGGHSYGAFGLVNPAYAMAEAMSAFSRIDVPDEPKTTFSIGVIGGGTSVNSIPTELWMLVDMRSVSVDELARVEGRFLDIVQRAADTENFARSTREGPITAEAVLIGDRPAGSTPEDSPLVQSLVATLRAFDVEPTFNTSSTDSNLPMSLGIPAATVGRGAEGKSGRSHSLDEWVDVEKAPDVAALSTGLAMVLAVGGVAD